MENIKISGIKQFLLEMFNLVVNIFFMVIVMIVGNLLFIKIVEYSKNAIKLFNETLAVVFFLYLLLQNVFVKSIFYFILNYKIECEMKTKIGILCHNFIFNAITIGIIVVQVCEISYKIKLILYALLIVEFVPCFLKKYLKSLSCYIFKIETVKIPKEIKNNGIQL